MEVKLELDIDDDSPCAAFIATLSQEVGIGPAVVAAAMLRCGIPSSKSHFWDLAYTTRETSPTKVEMDSGELADVLRRVRDQVLA